MIASLIKYTFSTTIDLPCVKEFPQLKQQQLDHDYLSLQNIVALIGSQK
jgi:hypothetical protein